MPEFMPGRSYSYSGVVDAIVLRDSQVDPIDLIEVDTAQLPVKELRGVLAQAVTRPFGVNRLLWLRNSEAATHIQQNTLLKILEEPSPNLIIVLEARNLGRFLPTVRSRLYTVRESAARGTMSAVIPADSTAREKYLRTFTERADLTKALEQERCFQAEQFLLKPTNERSQLLKLLEKTLQRLTINANLKLIVDSLLLHWPSGSGKP